jgi:predicted dehydrogenase
VLIEFEGGAGGVVGGVRPTPYFWRVHAFGTQGSVEAIGPTELVVRMSGADPQRLSLEKVDTLHAELEAFADAVEGRAPYPISADEIVATVAAFEAAVESIATRAPVQVGAD